MTESTMGPTIDEGSTDVAGIVENMGKSKAVALSDQEYSVRAVLGDDAPPPADLAEAPSLQDLGLMGVVSDPSAVIRAQPAATVDASLEPGLTERGWSPEVTARHPKLVAATMEELASGAGEASEGALVGDLSQHKNWLKQAAIQLNFKRLTQGLNAFAGTSETIRAAFAEAVAEAQASAGEGDGTGAPRAATAAARGRREDNPRRTDPPRRENPPGRATRPNAGSDVPPPSS